MKYISRLMALLLAMTLLIGSASAEFTLDGLTETQLLALYQATSEEYEYDYLEADVLGYDVVLSVEDGENLAANGYAFQWYQLTEAEEGYTHTALAGETGYTCERTYPLNEEKYYCAYTDAAGNEYMTKVFVLTAQTDDLDAYIDTLYTCYDEMVYVDELPLADYAAVACKWMNETWNVLLADGSNLAQLVRDYWYTDPYIEMELLCSCVVSGAVESDACILSPAADHAGGCGWYTGSPVLELSEETDADGNVFYTLSVTVDGETNVIATTELLDGVHHYFKDATTGIFVAWLYTDEDGVHWIVPLESEN